MTSLEILNKCHLDLFPKKKTICDDVDCMRIVDQLPILNGEYIHYIGPSGKQNKDILLATNFRIFLLMHESVSFINVPIMLVELIEIKEILCLYVYLKNAKTIRLPFSCSEKAALWYQRLNSIISKPIKLEELFAFTFYSWLTNEKCDEVVDSEYPTRYLFSKKDQSNIIFKEYKRMKFDSKIWRLTDVNKNFEVCPTYPENLIMPVCISDDQIKKISSFRSSKRFPAVVWRSKANGAVLARSSQPNVGLLGWRLNEDELLIKAIADSSFADNNTTKKTNAESCQVLNGLNENAGDLTRTVSADNTDESSMLLIIDARFRSVALANRVKGGGYEYTEYYTNCDLQFMNLENIHVIRSSFQALRLLCQSVNDNKTFYSQLESTKWLQHLSGIIKAACTVTNSIDRQAKSALIHCSDGWDRTPQILSLAKLMLDPFYRTIDGFRILIEHDWLMFGHKFAQRNGHAANHNDINERCPVFLQWLDCVYQIQRQFSWAFEFNETCLLKLCYHSYSCLFGTFLCDSVIERVNDHIEDRTFSIWSYLNDKNKEIINYMYDDSFEDVLYPNYELLNMQLWSKLFCDSEVTYLVSRQDLQHFNDSMELATNSVQTIMSPEEPISGNFLNGSTHHIDDDLDLEANISDLKLNIHSNSSLSLKSINTSHSTNQGTALKNFDATRKVDQQMNKVALVATAPQKTRSFEDLSRSFKVTDFDTSIRDALKKNLNTSIIEDSTGHDCLNNLSASDFPISIRSCSESNLLFDALQPITSTSPKQISPLNGTNSSFLTNPIKPPLTIDTIKQPDANNHHQTSCTLDHFKLTKNSTAAIQANESFDITEDIPMSTCAPDVPIKPTGVLVNKLSSSAVHMQESTDTLVDEASLVNRQKLIDTKLGSSMNTDKMMASSNGLNILDDVFELNNKKPTDPQTGVNLTHQTSDVASTPISSSIPSPDTSLLNLHTSSDPLNTATNFIQKKNFVSASNSTNNISNEPFTQPRLINNNVSTSTSGLSDYVTSAKFRYINDTIKSFEKNFNEQRPHGKTSSIGLVNSVLNDTGINMMSQHLATKTNGVDQFDAATSTSGELIGESRSSRLKFNGSNGHHGGGNKRIASKSIPIVRKNGDEKKKKNKTIQDCIDIDGLTKVDDKSCRKIVERDNQYKKEIATLKEQVNKCKSFLNTLSAKTLWQDGPNLNSFIKNDLADKSLSEENHLTSNSFSNDSVCSSSWDEIEESDYRLAPWVPDYYVTHCQGCNNKFSYRLRKHHCRNCGQVFCYQCADQFLPLPSHNLTAPARVCYSCMLTINGKKSLKKSINRKSSPSSNSSASLLANPIKYDKQHQKKILIQNSQGFYINACQAASATNNSNTSASIAPTNGPLSSSSTNNCTLNQRCNQSYDTTCEFNQNGNKTQKVSV